MEQCGHWLKEIKNPTRILFLCVPFAMADEMSGWCIFVSTVHEYFSQKRSILFVQIQSTVFIGLVGSIWCGTTVLI